MPAENWQNSVLFLVSFMHVSYVDKEVEQISRNCPPYGCMVLPISLLFELFEHYRPVSTLQQEGGGGWIEFSVAALPLFPFLMVWASLYVYMYKISLISSCDVSNF